MQGYAVIIIEVALSCIQYYASLLLQTFYGIMLKENKYEVS